MGGSVGVNSAPGYGSLLGRPAAGSAATPAAPAEGDALAPLQGGRVLIAEGQPGQHADRRGMLERWGLDVTQATTAPARSEAVEAAAAAGQPFDWCADGRAHAGDERPCGGARAARARFDAETLPVIALTAAALTLRGATRRWPRA